MEVSQSPSCRAASEHVESPTVCRHHAVVRPGAGHWARAGHHTPGGGGAVEPVEVIQQSLVDGRALPAAEQEEAGAHCAHGVAEPGAGNVAFGLHQPPDCLIPLPQLEGMQFWAWDYIIVWQSVIVIYLSAF